MTPTLIVLRGNSGSGKTSVAKAVQGQIKPAMLVSQDIIRREILKTKDTPQNPAIKLIMSTALYAKEINHNVIVEGILSSDKYGDMLVELIDSFPRHLVYYFDVPFEETLRRHASKPNSKEFGEKEMRQWWIHQDTLNLPTEHILPESLTLSATTNRIVNDFKNHSK